MKEDAKGWKDKLGEISADSHASLSEHNRDKSIDHFKTFNY